MLTIWKYELTIDDTQTIEMQAGAFILSASVQSDNIVCLYALVDPDAHSEPRTIEIYGTGHPVRTLQGSAGRFIGTVRTHGGKLVWHIFELMPEPDF